MNREERERLGFAFTTAGMLDGGEASEPDQPGLLRVQFESTLPHPISQFAQEAFRVVLSLEARHEVVGIPDDD